MGRQEFRKAYGEEEGKREAGTNTCFYCKFGAIWYRCSTIFIQVSRCLIMAIHIHLDIDYIEEFSLANTKRYIKINNEWLQVDKGQDVVYYIEDDIDGEETILYTEGDAYA